MARIELGIELDNGTRITSHKIQIIETVEKLGSISEAARELGLSYRGAWQIISELNTASRYPLVIASSGGRRGGGAILTDVGHAYIDSYRSIQRESKTVFAAALSRFEAMASQ